MTDERGYLVVRGLALGPASVVLHVPKTLRGYGGGYHRLYRGVSRSVEITRGSGVDLTLDPPRLIGVAVYDASSQRAVKRFTISDPEAKLNHDVDGNMWQGWVRSQADLEITVPGGVARLDAEDCPPYETVRVAVSRAAAATAVELRGLPARRGPSRVKLAVYRRTSGGLILAWKMKLDFSSARVQEVSLPERSLRFEGELVVRLSCSRGPWRDLEFHPEWQDWEPGGTLVFTARKPEEK